MSSGASFDIVAPMEQSSLYDRPDLYDLIAPPDPILERFYVEMAHERGARVLDLACGSGRLSIPLAKAGLQVVGGDLSSEMLQRARRSAETQSIELDLVQLDVRDFDLRGRAFDTIIVAMNSVLHLHSVEDFRSFFRSVARHHKMAGWYSTPSCRILRCSVATLTSVNLSEERSTTRWVSLPLRRPSDTTLSPKLATRTGTGLQRQRRTSCECPCKCA